MRNTPARIVRHAGIHYATVRARPEADDLVDEAGDWQRFSALAVASRRMLEHTDEDEIKVIIGSHSILVLRSESAVAAVVVTTGHPVVKSLKRMARKLVT